MRIELSAESSHVTRGGDLRLGAGAQSFEPDIIQRDQLIMKTDARALAVELGLYFPRYAPSVDLMKNIEIAKKMFWTGNWSAFYDASDTTGIWDFKQIRSEFAEFSQWHWGVMAAAFGIPLNIALRGAGHHKQSKKVVSPRTEGHPLDLLDEFSLYGNIPKDSFWLEKGYKAFETIMKYPKDFEELRRWSIRKLNEEVRIRLGEISTAAD